MDNLNEEVSKIKHLFNFKKGDVIIESMTKEPSDSKTIKYDTFKEGDEIRYDKGGFTVELTSGVGINEPGNFTYDIKVIDTYGENDKIKGDSGVPIDVNDYKFNVDSLNNWKNSNTLTDDELHSIKPIDVNDYKIKKGETGTLNLFDYDDKEGIDELEIYIGGYHKAKIKPNEIKKIN